MKFYGKLALTLTFLALSSGCGRQTTESFNEPRYSNEALNEGLKPFFDAYMQAKGAKMNYSIKVRLENIAEDGVAAYCSSWDDPDMIREIVVDREYWKAIHDMPGATYAAELILHELGHCDLNRDHVEDERDNKPVSIMHPYNFSFDASDEAYYVNELFGRK